MKQKKDSNADISSISAFEVNTTNNFKGKK